MAQLLISHHGACPKQEPHFTMVHAMTCLQTFLQGTMARTMQALLKTGFQNEKEKQNLKHTCMFLSPLVSTIFNFFLLLARYVNIFLFPLFFFPSFFLPLPQLATPFHTLFFVFYQKLDLFFSFRFSFTSLFYFTLFIQITTGGFF